MELQLLEVEAHRVYQRNEQNESDIPFGIRLSEPAAGRVEARLYSATYSTPWLLMGYVDGETFEGVIEHVPVGAYGMEFRIVGVAGIANASVHPVFVGDLWLLAGQSNMEGCGKEVGTETPVEGVSCFYMGDRWGIAEDPLCLLQESIDPVNWRVPEEKLAEEAKRMRRERANGAGLGMTFAKELLRETGVPIGLVMCAHGGTSMAQWDPERLHEGGRSFYGAMIRKVRKLGGRVKGCLWYQGESDANEQAAPLYADRMVKWVESLRRDTEDATLPFIYAQLSLHYNGNEGRWWNLIQHEQLLLEGKLAGVRMVPTIDASLSDGIHLDAQSLQAVGRRMAWEALRHVYGRPTALSGPRPAAFEWNRERTALRISFTGINNRLAPVRQAFGFHVEVAGEKQPLYGAVADDGEHIVLSFELPVPPDTTTIRHGIGLNPVINVRDGLGIPLPVFGPIPI